MPVEQFAELTEEFDQGTLADNKEAFWAVRCVPFRIGSTGTWDRDGHQ